MQRNGVCDYEPKPSMYKHGMYKTSIYKTWSSMKARCNNPNRVGYENWGGRGIKVCKRWNDFVNFFEDMGERPSSSCSLDRINNNENYSKENCRWATRKEQNRNHRGNRMLKYGGKEMTLTCWAEKIGIKPKTLSYRINGLGWDVEKALTMPIETKYRHAVR